jgi:hypothetical protein
MEKYIGKGINILERGDGKNISEREPVHFARKVVA